MNSRDRESAQHVVFVSIKSSTWYYACNFGAYEGPPPQLRGCPWEAPLPLKSHIMLVKL